MKIVLKTASHLFAVAVISFCTVAVAYGQSRESRLISAQAGAINFVSGEASFRRADERAPRRLSTQDELQSGDVVKTGALSQVEVLLNPGSYLRLGENSEFELTDNSLDNLRVKLLKGSAVVEAAGNDDAGFSIAIDTPRERVSFLKSGVYRLNVLPEGITEVAVQRGRASVGKNPATLVKSGKVARIGAGGVELVKLEKKNRDYLDLWSKERGEELARVNQKLSARSINSLLASSNYDYLFSSPYAMSSMGVWLWSPVNRCYTFLPSFYGYRSPYGHWYGHQFGLAYGPPCRTCPVSVLHPVVTSAGTTLVTPTMSSPGGGGPIRVINPGPIDNPGGRESARPIDTNRPVIERGAPGIDRPAPQVREGVVRRDQ